MTKEMNKRITSLFLAFTMLLQIFMPQNIFAEGDKSLPQDKYVKVGMIDGKSYDAKIMNELNRIAAKNRKSSPGKPGVRLFSKGPYFGDNNEPKDEDKPKYFGNVSAQLDLKGLDGNKFQWNKIFGVDESGNPKPAQIIFRQMDAESSTDTGIEYILQITKGGKYTWSDGEGKPTKLPLFSKSLKPYRYEVRIDERVSDKVKLLTEVIFGTEGSSPTFSPENADGEIIANITLGLTYQQIASTKFKSEWHTDVVEADRPGMKANFAFDDEGDGLSPVSVELPKNDKDTKIIRDWLNDFDPDLVMSIYLEKTPDVKIDETTAGLTFEEADGVKTVKSGDHKFKYDFTYDVINGGKLTMTEILPVTFDANDGKFANFTAPDTETKIVKEVEYDGTLTEKAEDPTKDRETFKGWSTTQDGKNPVTDQDLKNITKAKTFYAIWEDKAFTADGLTVHESFKDDSGYVNDFIPTIEQLKGQVKVDRKELAEQDQLAILNDDGQPLTDEKAIKDYLYTKLGEENDNKVDRTVEIKGRVTDAGGKTHDVTIPIKVIKNIYEAKTQEGKPDYVPDNYVKVTLDPTTKAKDPQKYFYYVNPKASVVIPGKDPVGTDGNNFINWTSLIDGSPAGTTPSDFDLTTRHQFEKATTITANYVGNIVEQKGDDKPNVPDDFVKVIVDTTDQASEATRFTRTFWVKKNTPVRIKVDNPVAANAAEAFSKWRTKQDDGSNTVIDLNVDQTFSKEETFIKAFYSQLAIKQPGDKKPDEVPDNFIKIVFDTTEKAKDPKQSTWWVAPNNKDIRIELVSPEGKEVTDGSGSHYKWKFDNSWKSETNEAKHVDVVGGKNIYRIDTTKVSDGEIFYAQYTTSNVIPYDPANPIDQPEGYVNVTFKAETGLSLKAPKAYYVKKNAGITLKTIKDDTTGFGYPAVKEKAGYAFDTWDPAEDTEIKDRDIVVTAKAKHVSDVIEKKDGVDQPQGYVEVTFVPTDKAMDKKERTFWVNPEKEVTIPVTDPKGTTYYTFEEWKIGANADGDVYKPTVGKKFTENTIITATYKEAANIIPYDPKEPMTKPAGYVRVSFEADKGLSLSNVQYYYVKENAGIKLGDTSLVKPNVAADTGYKFEKWNKDDATEITNVDVVVTAKATKLDMVIPATNDQGQPNEKPEGYKEVNFVIKTEDRDKGSITSVAKFYVNPTEYVTINPLPTTKAETGYEFGGWDKDASIPTVYKEDVTTITGSFNGLKDIIPNKNPDGTENQKPDGYKTVTFVIDPNVGGKIVDGEIKVYYVNPAKDVTVPQPKTIAETGYVFEKWDQDTMTAKKYADDTTVKGNFKKLDDIIPSTNDQGKPNAKPDGYITVTFDKGDHGKEITGQTVYYVNPKADPVKTLAAITKPTVKAETGYKFTGWDKADTDKIIGMQDITVTAQYTSIADIVPGGEPKPEGYITVTFEKGNHGTLEGTTVYYVNPNKAVVLKDKAPRIKPDTGYKSAGWDTTIEKAIQYEEGDKITALYNKLGDISTTEVAGYVKVVFNKGASGTLEGTQAYWIKPDVEVNIPAPTVKPNVGYKFDKWDKSLTVKAKANDPTYEITALYAPIDNIVPGDKPKPDGYVTITFKAENGSLSGTTTYYVNPNKEADFTQIAANMTKKPNIGYTEKGGSWSPANFKKTFTTNAEFKFSFEKLENVIPAKEGEDRPEGYVTVTLIPTYKATVTTEKSYWVKADTDVTITDEPVGTKVKDANGITYDYTFTGWTATRGTIAFWTGAKITGKFIQDTEITAQYKTNVDAGTILPAPVPKKDAVTPINDEPKPEDLIKNVPGSEKDPLPEGTTFKYTDDGKPDVTNPGTTTAKVEVKYPNGKTTIVEVPITVVDNVVPQDGGEDGKKPLVPDNYVKVTVDTTDAATPNTKFKKVFWVKPDVKVTIPDILAPTGKEETIDGVKKINKFVEWKLEGSDPAKTYKEGITDTFTAKENTIVATYEYDKNVEPKGKDNPWIPQNSDPSPKDFIKNPYDDNDPNNPNNLPPGTRFEFVEGQEPDTSEPGEGKKTTIKVIYPNGETKEVPVTFRVTGDVVEQTDPDKKPNVPDNFVEVIVKTTDKATEDVTRTFWVNPTKVVAINVADPEGKDLGDKKYVFTGWNKSLRDQFTMRTVITAQYQEYAYDPDVITGVVATDLKVQPPLKDYVDEIQSKEPFRVLRVVAQPDVSEPGMKMAKVEIQFRNGVKKIVDVRVYVKPDPKIIEKPVPGDCNNSCDQPNVGKDALNTTDHYQYLIGYPDGNFGPNKGMTRAEAATMFTRLLRQRPVKGQRYNAGLNDIHAGDWYANTVGYAVQRGIVSGYPDGSFKPNKPITRAEFAAIASRFDALAQGNDIAFSDLAPSHWGYNAIRSAASKGWISGYPDNTFRPEQAITRAEVTAITNRMLNRHADLYWIDAHRGEVIRFGDVKRGDWYFEPIMEATMGHDFIRDRDGKTEHWTGLNGKSFI